MFGNNITEMILEIQNWNSVRVAPAGDKNYFINFSGSLWSRMEGNPSKGNGRYIKSEADERAAGHFRQFDVMCTVRHIAMCRWPARCTVLINNFYSTVFSCCTCFERSARPSSAARLSWWHDCTDWTKQRDTVYQAVLLIDDGRVDLSKHVQQENTVE